jgi:hypothetical protein
MRWHSPRWWHKVAALTDRPDPDARVHANEPRRKTMPDYPTIEACIGGTPLVRLQRLPGDSSNTVLAKLEGNNPAGSVKDRPA